MRRGRQAASFGKHIPYRVQAEVYIFLAAEKKPVRISIKYVSEISNLLAFKR